MAVYKHESRSRVEYAHTNRITIRYSSEIQESVFLSFSQKPVTPFGTQKLAGVSVALEEKKEKIMGSKKVHVHQLPRSISKHIKLKYFNRNLDMFDFVKRINYPYKKGPISRNDIQWHSNTIQVTTTIHFFNN